MDIVGNRLVNKMELRRRVPSGCLTKKGFFVALKIVLKKKIHSSNKTEF